jgi:hypothetical protein
VQAISVDRFRGDRGAMVISGVPGSLVGGTLPTLLATGCL